MGSEAMRAGSRNVEISRADKVLFPGDGITKMHLALYYGRIGSVMLPYVKGRPLTMQRFPDGIGGEGFYEKKAPDHFPPWVKRVSVDLEEGGFQSQVVCDNAATLVYLADQACITPHVWLSRGGRLRHPDRMIFDLDPPDGDFGPVRDAARALRDILETVGLSSYVMTTGSRGLHVAVPLDGSATFDTVRDFASAAARLLADREQGLTMEVRKEKRKGRLFVDTLRNAYGQTAVAPYAVRALPGAPVAAPLDWDELGRSGMGPRRFRIDNIFRRLGRKDDPWRGMARHARSLEGPRRKLERMNGGKS